MLVSEESKASNRQTKCLQTKFPIGDSEHEKKENADTFRHSAIPDTGASMSVIAHDLISLWGFAICKDHFLQPIYSCSNNVLKCYGVAHLEIACGSRFACTAMIVVEQPVSEMLICCDDLIRLGILPDSFPQPLTCNYAPQSQNFQACNSELSIKQRLDSVFKEFDQVFSEQITDFLKPMEGPPMTIHLKKDSDVRPIRVLTARRVPIHLVKAAEKEVASLLQQGILRKITKPTTWCSPAMFVEKPDGSLRLVTDFRVLNKCVERPVHPFPTAQDIISLIPAGTKFFVKFDALKGYFQIPLDEASVELTTCMVPGHSRMAYNRAPMGLCSSGDEYCARGDAVLSGIDGVKKIVDDILIFAPDLDTLITRVTEVLKRCSENTITLSKKKVQFGDTVKFAGYLIASTGIRPDPDKLKAIRDFPPPTNITELRSFLGLANQLGQFIPDLAQVTQDVRSLLKKNVHWLWLEEHNKSFELTKKVLLEQTVLHYYDSSASVELMTDASRLNGIGFVLLQKSQQQKHQVIQCGSRSLTETEKRYATIELELLAVVWSIHKCRIYLASRHFILITDHKPLIGVFEKDRNLIDNTRIQRLLLKIAGYTFSAQWMPGKQLSIADALSRRPVFSPTDSDIDICAVLRSEVDPKLKELFKCAEEDKQYQELVKIFLDPIPFSDMSDTDPKKKFSSIWNEVSMDKSGMLLYGDRIIVPASYRQKILDLLHLPHAGISRTREQAKRYYYWPGMNEDIQNLVRNCEECQESRPSKPKTLPLVKTTASAPMESVSADLFQIGSKHYVVMVDRHSGYPWVSPLTRLDSASVIKVMSDWFIEFGLPKSIRTDGGPQFRSQFAKFCEENGIQQETSSPYYPQSNGHAEAAVKNMKFLLKKCKKWDDFKIALREWRNTPRSGSSKSPADLMFKRRQRTKLPVSEKVGVSFSGDSLPSVLEEKSHEEVHQQLPIGAHVLVQDSKTKKWDTKGKVIGKRASGRSYTVETDDNKVITRNIKYLKHMQMSEDFKD